MGLSLLTPPPADPTIARRLLATTAFTPPERAVLGAVVPWTLVELKVAVYHGHETEVVPVQQVPAGLEPHVERILRSSRARWFRPAELPPSLAEAVGHELDRWRQRRKLAIRGASALVRAEHGYRMTFRTETEQVTIELALAPPRIVHEERCPVLKPRPSWLGRLRTLIAGGAEPSRSRASGGA